MNDAEIEGERSASGPGEAEAAVDVLALLEQARAVATGLEQTLGLSTTSMPIVQATTEAVDERGVAEIGDATQTVEMVATVKLAEIASRGEITKALCKAARRGVRVTLLLSPHDLTHPHIGPTMQRFVSQGVQVRIAMHAPSLTLLMIDRRVALVRPIGPDEPGLIIHGTPVVPALAHLALAYWSRSAPVPPSVVSDAEPSRLKARQRQQLLELLVSGVKDESAARELGVSLRSYRRYVRQLMDELGASSRFEAGFLAAERGWYTPSVRSHG